MADDYFADKAPQMDTDGLTAFGISLTTRYSKATELAEMLGFAAAAATAGVHGHVTSVSYDSKASLCTFEFTGVDEGGPVYEKLLAAALAHIRQFDWYGTVYHGADLADGDGSDI